MLLSVCLIARNEESFLAGCLDSIAPLRSAGDNDGAGEVIVVDTGSTDRTCEIARSYGCRVLHHTWADDFAASRNRGIDAARGQWVFCIDADERLCHPGPLLHSIRSAPPQAGGFLLERHDIVTDPEDGRTIVNPIGIVRVFRRQSDIRYLGIVHERPGDTILRAGYEIHTATGVKLDHLVNHLSNERLRQKQEIYLGLLSREINADPGNFWAYYYRGKTLWYLRRLPEAIDDFRTVACATEAATDLQPWALNMLAGIYCETNACAEALRCLEASLALRPDQSLAFCVLGDVHYRMGNFGAAIDAYARVQLALDSRQSCCRVQGDLYMTLQRRSYKLGCCYLALGNLPEAFAHFSRGAEADPPDAACHFGLANIALACNDTPLAQSLLTTCSQLDTSWRTPRELLHQLAASARPPAPSPVG